MTTLGDFLNSINFSKADLLSADPLAEKEYIPFVINRSLSYFIDTVLIANEMNQMQNLPKNMQYQFALKTIRSRKRFSKWAKKTDSEEIDLIKRAFGYNNQHAEQALKLLTSEQLAQLKEEYSVGGNAK